MKNKGLRIHCFIIILLVVTLVLTIPITQAQAKVLDKTSADALAWLWEKKDTVIEADNSPVGGDAYAQCVDLILAYYDFLGVQRQSGNAKDYTTNTVPDGMTRIKDATPQTGDVLIYLQGTFGHVAIYESEYVTWHQNVSIDGGATYIQRVTRVVGNSDKPWFRYTAFGTYWGVIRPTFSSGITITPQWYPATTSNITETNARVESRIQHGIGTTLSEGGCILGTSAQVNGASISVTSGVVTRNTNGAIIAYDANPPIYTPTSTSSYNETQLYYFADGSEGGTTKPFNTSLSPNTTYYYKFYGIINGTVFESAVTSFQTSSSATYALQVVTSAGGSVNTSVSGNYTENAAINLSAMPNSNYSFSHWTSSNGGTFANEYNRQTTFTMPKAATTVTANFVVTPIQSFSVTPNTLDFGTLNVGYGTQTGKAVTITNTGNQGVTLNTLGAPANYNFLWGSKTTLAAGENTTLTVTPSTGLTAGNYDTQVFISSTNTTAVAALNLKLTVDRVPVAPTITTDSLPNGTVNTSYTTQQLIATGDTPFTWSHSSGSLPTGLTLSSNGLLGGTPIQAGTFTFTVSVSNGVSPSATKQYTITIYAAPTYTMSFAASSIDLGSAITGYNRYTYGQFATVHNTGNQTITIGESPQWQYFQLDGVQTNPLPSGSSTICVIQPKEGLSAGNYSETLTITGSNGATATIQASFVVTAPSYTISAAPTTLLFGSLNIGYTQPAAQTVTITNTGNQSVTLSQPTATNYALSNLNATTLAAGATATFAVQPKPNLPAGTYNETISIAGSNGVSESVTVQFQVNTPAEYRISATPATLSFGSLNTGYTQPAAQTVTITNTGNQSVTLSQPTATNYTLSNLNATNLAAGATATFAVQPKPNLPAGTYNETISIAGSNGVSESVTVQFQVNTPAEYRISATPATLSFGSLNTGYTQPAAQTVTITNTGNQSVTLSQPTATNYTLSNLNATNLAAGATATFAVQPKPNLPAGTYNETISIAGSNGVSESVTVQFQVNTPAEYRISATPASLSFSSLSTGYTQPAAQTVTITNTGNQSVTLSQPTATNYALSNLNATTLAAGATATFAVQPKPNLPAGIYNETINIVGSNGVSASVSAQFQVSTPPSPTVQVSPSATIMLGNAGIVNLTIGSNITGFNANNFMYLHMDGVNVLPSNSTFIVRDGSIIIQMNPIYLNTLSLGSHVVTIGLQGSGYENTKVSTTIMVVTNPSVVPPKTGDSTPIAFLAMLMLLSAFGIGFTLKGKTWRKAS